MQKKIILKHFFSKQGSQLVFEFYHPLYEPKICLHIAIPKTPDTFFGILANAEGQCRFVSTLDEFAQRYELNIINEERLIQQAYAYVKAQVPKRLLVNYLVYKYKDEFYPPKQLFSITQDINTQHILINVQNAQASVTSLDMREVFEQACEFLQHTPALIINFDSLALSSSPSGRRD